MVSSTVTVSSPGKVLLTGAYLVLERPNAGLVISTSARFFASTKEASEQIDEDQFKKVAYGCLYCPSSFLKFQRIVVDRNFTLYKNKMIDCFFTYP